MKKLISSLLIIAAIVLLAACGETNAKTTAEPEILEGQDSAYVTPEEIANDTERVKVTGLTIENKQLSCAVASLFVLSPVFTPADATYKDVIYTSTDDDVVKYNEQLGMFTASVNGTAKIRITSKDGGYFTTVTVKVGTGVKEIKTEEEETVLKGITASSTAIELGEGDNTYIEILPVPSVAKITGAIKFTSTDEGIAYVSKSNDGRYVIYGVSAGSATITAETSDGAFTCSIKVAVNSYDEKAVSSITLDKSEKTLSVGGSFTLKATVKPDSAVNKYVIWMSSDNDIAEVDVNGKVTAKKSGTVTITAMAIDGGYTAECVVTVK